jgi:hypothetical protein
VDVRVLSENDSIMVFMLVENAFQVGQEREMTWIVLRWDIRRRQKAISIRHLYLIDKGKINPNFLVSGT